MRLCPRGSQLHENHFAPQPLEITPFRLTPPFRLAYTDFIGPERDFQPRPGSTNIYMTFLARIVRFLFWLLVASWAIWLLRSFVGWMLRNFTTAARTSTETGTPMDGRQMGRRLVRSARVRPSGTIQEGLCRTRGRNRARPAQEQRT